MELIFSLNGTDFFLNKKLIQNTILFKILNRIAA